MIDLMVKEMNISLNTVQYILKNLREGFDLDQPEELEYFSEYRYLKDFFSNPDWGQTKELLYTERFGYHTRLNAPICMFYIVDDNFDMNKFKLTKAITPCVQTNFLWLGRIRNIAYTILSGRVKLDITLPKHYFLKKMREIGGTPESML